jgi:excisionase family DNA binding protein
MQFVTRGEAAVFSEADRRLVESSCRKLRGFVETSTDRRSGDSLRAGSFRVSVESATGEKTDLALPQAALPLLLSLLQEIGREGTISPFAQDREVSTQEAAAYLNVSRPYFVKLLQQGALPFRTVGPRRRVLLKDLLAYQAKEEADRHRGLNELAAEAQKLGLY